MSRQVAALVYARKTGSAMRKSILAYMAERANDDGSGIWCSKQRIADEIEASRGAVITNIQEMVEEGLLVEVGKRRHQNGWTMEYSICLRKVAALPAAQKDDPFKIERVEAAPVQEDDATRNPGERQDVQQDDTNRPITVLEPSTYVGPIWDASPAKSKNRSSRKLLKAALEKLPKTTDGEALLQAWKDYLSTPDAQRLDFEYVPAVHRWFTQGRWEQHIKAPVTRDLLSAEPEMHEGLKRERWESGIAWYVESGGGWDLDAWSPPPHKPGCKAPADLLAKAKATADWILESTGGRA